MAVRTRRGTEADLPLLLALEKGCFKDRPFKSARFKEVFKYGQDLLVRERDGKLIALGVWTWTPTTEGRSERLHLLCVAPEERRQGHASALMKQQLVSAKKEATVFVEVTTRVSNTVAHAFLEHFAFVAEPRSRGTYPDAEPALHWRLELAKARSDGPRRGRSEGGSRAP